MDLTMGLQERLRTERERPGETSVSVVVLWRGIVSVVENGESLIQILLSNIPYGTKLQPTGKRAAEPVVQGTEERVKEKKNIPIIPEG